jgi:DNA-binding IclR family transcriptional regulator
MHVKQISNLFSLMDLFARTKKPLSVRDIVDEFSWPRSSAFNIISTLVDRVSVSAASARRLLPNIKVDGSGARIFRRAAVAAVGA